MGTAAQVRSLRSQNKMTHTAIHTTSLSLAREYPFGGEECAFHNGEAVASYSPRLPESARATLGNRINTTQPRRGCLNHAPTNPRQPLRGCVYYYAETQGSLRFAPATLGYLRKRLRRFQLPLATKRILAAACLAMIPIRF